jgi:cysteine synthase
MTRCARGLPRLPDPIVERFGNIDVVRDDLIEGGSKTRFLPFLIKGADEVVFGGPFCGGAPLALSVLGRMTGQKVTLFYAKRKLLHRRQLQAKANGAHIIEVPHGYMSNVQAKARAYAKEVGALFLPLGFDLPAAEDPFVEVMRGVARRLGYAPDEVWCCAGSGMLTRCLSRAFNLSHVHAVAVGLASRHEAQAFGQNVTMHQCAYRFEQEAKARSPFPSCPNYDRKAWEIAAVRARGRAVFWNVAA